MHSKLLEISNVAIIVGLLSDRNTLRPKQSKLFVFQNMGTIKRVLSDRNDLRPKQSELLSFKIWISLKMCWATVTIYGQSKENIELQNMDIIKNLLNDRNNLRPEQGKHWVA